MIAASRVASHGAVCPVPRHLNGKTPVPAALAVREPTPEMRPPPPIVENPTGVYVRLPPELAPAVTRALDEGRAILESFRTAEGAVRSFVEALAALEKRRRR